MKILRYVLFFGLIAGMGVAIPLSMGFQRTASGDPVAYDALGTPKCYWRSLGTITSSQAYPDVADRDATTVAALADAKTITWDVPADASGAQFYFETSADADSTTLQMLVAAGRYQSNGVTDDNYALGATFALVGGTQVGSNTNVIADTVTVTDGILDFAALDSGNNRICVVEGDLKGMEKVVFVASTLQEKTTCRVYARWY